MRFRNKNYGLSPFDPDYRDDYDEQEDFDRYLQAVEDRYQWEKENSII